MADPETIPAHDPAMLTQPDYVALAAKHRIEIDRILALTPQEQEKEIADRYGMDPRVIENHYKDLEVRGAELRRQGAVANHKTWLLAVGGFFATAALTYRKRRAIHESGLVQFTVGSLAAFSAGLAATLAGGHLFGGNLKKDGKALAVESRDAFERELAVAIENKERATAAISATPEDSLETSGAMTMTDKITPRDASFAAQAAVEKQAAVAQQAGLA